MMQNDAMEPKLAMCNFIPDVEKLRRTVVSLGFEGVDWTFTLEDLPRDSGDESRLLSRISRLFPLEVRYHCAFKGVDLGDADHRKARESMEVFRRACRMVSRLEGRFVTIHMGLGRSSMNGLVWERSLEALTALVDYAGEFGVCVCLENLATGWSSRPELFERLVRKSGAGITLDIGHALVSPSIESQSYSFEDFALPNMERVFNAHIYHEERDGRHFPPEDLSDICERLNLVSCLPCDWWVLELRNEKALGATHEVVREFIRRKPAFPPREHFGIL